MSKEVKFRNKSGELTNYSLSCGYIFNIDKDEKNLQLWKEHSVFHVRLFDHKEKKRIFWEVFEPEQLLQAKDLFYKSARENFGLSRMQAIKEACFSH